MVRCVACGKAINSWEALNGQCEICFQGEDKTIEQAAFDTRKLDTTIDAIMLTTSHTLQGIEVTKYLGVVSAECAYGMNMFKDMFANIRNLVGGRSTAVQDTMRDSRETVMQELKREAHAKGANAVIAVDID